MKNLSALRHPAASVNRMRPHLERLEDRLAPATVSWIGGSGDWNVAANWDLNRLPNATDDAVIFQTGITVTHGTGTDQVRSLTSLAALTVSGGTLTLARTSTLGDALTVSAGTLDGPGDLYVEGALAWTGGTLGGRGTTFADGGGTISGTALKTLDGRALANSATITWTGTGNVNLTNGAVFSNPGGATFDIQTDAALNATGTGLSPAFVNAGTLKKSMGTGTATINTSAFRNSGTVQAQSGTLRLSAGGISTGTFSADAGATLAFGGGGATLTAASTVSGAGTVAFLGGTVNETGTWAVTGPTLVNGGAVNFNADATLATLTVSLGTLGGTATVTVSGALSWTGGSMAGTGVTLAQGGLMIDSASFKTLDTRTLVNVTTATWAGTGNLGVANAGTISNLSGATFDIQGDRALSFSGGAVGMFANAGMLLKSAGTGTLAFVNAVLNNTGTVEVQSGTLSLSAGGVSSGSIVIDSGATLSFNGGTYTLGDASNLSGDGTVTFLSGTVNVTGSYAVTGATRVNGGTVNFNTDLTLTAVSVVSGTLGGTATVTVSGALTWSGGTMGGAGTTLIQGTLSVSGTGDKVLDTRALVNAGTVTWTGTGHLLTNNGATVSNLAGGTFDIQTNASIGTATGPTALFANAGTLLKSAGTGTTTFGIIGLANVGTVRVQTGTLFLFLAGGFANFADGTLTGGTYLISGTGTFQFAGADLRVNAATIILDGAMAAIVNQSGVNALANFAINVDSGSFTLQNGRNLTTAGDFLSAGALTVRAGSTFAVAGVLTQSGGTTTLADGTISTTGGFSLMGGVLSGSGTVTGNLTNAASVVVGDALTVGVLAITGNYTQLATGNLSVKLGGTGAGQSDQLAVAGTATLDGTLTADLFAGYTPVAGDVLTVIAVASESGSFGPLAGSAASFFAIFYVPAGVQLM